MKKTLYGLMLFVLATVGIFFVLKYGYEPTPTLIMKPSYFSSPEDIGATVYKRFYSPIEEQKIVVFGVPPQPDWQRQIVVGFLEKAALEKHPFDVVLAETQMPPLDLSHLTAALQVIQIPTNLDIQAELIDHVAELRKSGKRVLIYTASILSTHILPGNSISRYEKTTGEHLLAITSEPLTLHPNQEYVVDPPCVGSERDVNDTANLGCAVLKSSRPFYIRKIPQERYVGIMNEQKPEDYLLMVSSPNQDKAEMPPAKEP
jgi:hypothetical protein